MASGPEPATSAASVREHGAYLLFETVRWPAGPPSCPHCGAPGRCRLLRAPDGIARPTRTGRPSARRVWRCGRCRRQFSVLTGTVFERTRVPLPLWLDAIRILSESTQPPSATALADDVGVSVETARAMSQLVRTALSAAAEPDDRRPQLQG